MRKIELEREYMMEVKKWKAVMTGLKTLSCIPYFGGKYYQVKKYLPYIYALATMNECNTYVEMTGGGARFLLNLNPDYFKNLVYNEMDLGLCSMFQSIKSDDYKLIIEVLKKTP
jgi:site-specific DNA-adenine methylase